MGHVGVIYGAKKAYTLEFRPGAQLTKIAGRAHEVILKEVVSFWQTSPSVPQNVSDFVSQDIALQQPFEWLRSRREDANYGLARCYEPLVPDHFKRIVAMGVRKSVAAYLHPSGDAYVFDPDHAMLCFPLRLWQTVLTESRAAGFPDPFTPGQEFLGGSFRDNAGPLPDLRNLL